MDPEVIFVPYAFSSLEETRCSNGVPDRGVVPRNIFTVRAGETNLVLFFDAHTHTVY